MEAIFPPEFTRTGTVDVRTIPATGKTKKRRSIRHDQYGIILVSDRN
jgi:hypothetical protein